MKPTRRNFLRDVSLGISGVASGLPLLASCQDSQNSQAVRNAGKETQHFNMCGYAAPKLDKVRIGFIGLGARGSSTLQRLTYIEGIDIKAICDKIPEKVAASQNMLNKAGLPKALEFVGDEAWKKLIESNDIDLIYICTPWKLHTPMGLYAMNNGKHAACEVPAALTTDECWQLVETSEKTRQHFIMLENTCYDSFELLTLNMARNGLFGDLVHAEGAYIHDLMEYNFNKGNTTEDWRLWENATRNGNLYPTHGIGPIAQCLGINRGDQFDYMVSISSADFNMGKRAAEKAATDPYYNVFAKKQFRGNINTSIIKTELGRTIMLQHDVSTIRPYSRIHLLSGTKGIAIKYPEPERIAFGEEWLKPSEFEELQEKYMPPIVKFLGEAAKKIGGHGGIDFLLDWRLIDCLRNGLPLDQDVYDAASWSVITPLSEKAVAEKAGILDIPDFTRGSWKSNKPINLTLEGGATTKVREG